MKTKTMQRGMKLVFSLIMVFALTVTMTAAAPSVSQAKKSSKTAKKAKKLKMKKKKVTITVGQKKTLKLTVSPKKAAVKWSSDKKKIASVSKKGVVTGKKAGKATITAKSGKKKATCKVTVKDKTAAPTPSAPQSVKYNLSSVQVLGSRSLRVTLDRAYALTVSDFVVKVKQDGKGAYNKTLKVASATNSGNRIYELALDTEESSNEINSNTWVSVTISKLNGVASGEVFYYGVNASPGNIYIAGTVDEESSTNVWFDEWARGYCTYQVSGLPAGYKTVEYSWGLKIIGASKTPLNGACTTITAKDELGKSFTRQVYFYIGSSSQLVTYATKENKTVLSGDGEDESINTFTHGGTGEYTYSLTSPNNESLYIYTEDGTIRVKDDIAPGNYQIQYRVTDSENHSVDGTFTLKVLRAVKISGSVRAADGTAMTISPRFQLENDAANEYYNEVFYGYFSQAGVYEAYVAPSSQYMAYFPLGDERQYFYGISVETTDKTLDFSLPLYKITLSAEGANLSEEYWFDKFGNEVGEGSVLYLKKGNYSISNSTGWRTPFYERSASFTVSKSGEVTLTSTPKVPIAGSLNVGTTTVTLEADTETWYTFTPPSDDNYTFTSSDIDAYVSAGIYESGDMNWEMQSAENDYSDSAVPLTFTRWGMSDWTYFIKFNCSENKTFTITVKKEESDDFMG
ncbi:MAG: Ig-like domain-containing protein [Lachnospiraceae bacterium]|nr:Ig-like domain-containing protein [Lachnospiraceae bacterium]